MAWQWLQRLWRPYQPVARLSELATGRSNRVEVQGRVEPLELLRDPVSGEDCVVIEYRAWPPSTTIGMDGATSHNSRAYQVNARQAADFVLVGDGARVLVRTDPGEDLEALHQRLIERYGVDLRAESEMVHAGQRLSVSGRVEHRMGASRTPHRDLPYDAVVQAERIRLVTGPQ